MTWKGHVSIILFGCLALAGTASAQSSRSGLEVAGQAAMLRLDDSTATNAGIGGRLIFDLSRWVSLDGEFSFFPKDKFEFDMGTAPSTARVAYERRRSEVLAGVKAGLRGDRFGVFGKARPGFTRLSHKGLGCVGDLCALALFALPEYRTEFALDLGGIVEFYPSPRAVLRVDLGDVMIRHRSFAPPCQSCTSHNFTSRFGVGYRF